MSSTSSGLLDQAKQLCMPAEFKRIVLRHCTHLQDSVPSSGFNTDIHPRDQMLIHSLQHHQNAEVALSQYFGVSLQQHSTAMQIYSCFLDQADRTVELLDFACGYGRLLRFLSRSLPAEQLWASEIQLDAVEFVSKAFGVRAVPSHLNPEQFQPGRQFDFIWVASLFSHLPDELFRKWMRRLISLLTPRGVLCCSVRGSELLPSGETLPESGLRYFRASEVTDLNADVYGTAYASEDYVRGAIGDVLGGGHPYKRLRKALAHEQDVYVVCRNPNQRLDVLDGFRRGPWGWLDRRLLSSNGELYLEGWAASLDDGPVEAVEVWIDGELHECTTGVHRGDVADALGDARLATSGWVFRKRMQKPVMRYRVEVTARSTRGELALLFAGTLAVSDRSS